MGLLQEWREYAYGVELNSKEGKAIWDKYFEQEKAIYQQLLAAPEEVVSGTVQELAELKKPMVQTDNSQSHRFSLSKYSGHSVIYICRIFKAHQNKHAHALAEIIDAFEPSECHDLRLFPLSNGNQIFPGCSITYPILLHFSGFFVLIQNINDIATGLYV